jgi:LacI family transcriptional regulator
MDEINSQEKFNESKGGHITIKDIAKKAGVSPATVGRVAGNYGHVKEKTRQKVLKIMKEAGYYPNEVARSLKTSRTKTIAYLVPAIIYPFYAVVASYIEEVASSHGCNLILCNTGTGANKLEKIATMLLESRIGGVIHSLPRTEALQTMIKAFQKRRIPIISAIGSRQFQNIDIITVDDVQGAKDAVRFLIELGHSSFGFLGIKKSTTSKLRKQGCIEAIREENNESLRFSIFEGPDFNEESGYSLMKVFLSEKKHPTAVVVFSDFMAMGTIRAIEEEGLSIPKDISLISFDNTFSRLTQPHLTSVALPVEEIGRIAAQILLERIEQKDNNSPKKILLKEKLIVRESTARPPIAGNYGID